VLALTPEGQRIADKLFATQREWLCDQLRGWSPDQQAELEPVLAKLSHALLGDEADRRLVDEADRQLADRLSRTEAADSRPAA
jgi:hypothetical protein